jgi:TonB family protein
MVKKILIFIIICGNTFYLYSQNKDSIEEMFSPPEIMPVKKDLCRFVLDRIVYPQDAINDTIGGIVLIDFHVEVNGKTTGHRVIKGVRDDLNDEALRVAKLLTFDEPAYSRRSPVRTTYVLPIHFLLDYDSLYSKYIPKIKCRDILSEQNDSNEITFALESWPDFNKESLKGLVKFIVENVREVDVPEGNSRVIVQFLVDTLGYTSNHKIIRGVNPELDNEALRISRLLKFERPAMQGCKPVNVTYTLPFDFKKLLLDKMRARKKINSIER